MASHELKQVDSHDYPVIASTNRYQDVGPYIGKLYAEDSILWGSIWPWEFPQSATREEEEAFIRRWFSETEIDVQGGATGDGNGFRFLKQVWYSAAIWNYEDRVPLVVQWWLDQNTSLWQDVELREHVLRPDVHIGTFFQREEVLMYGEKFLGVVVPHLQARLHAIFAQQDMPTAEASRAPAAQPLDQTSTTERQQSGQRDVERASSKPSPINPAPMQEELSTIEAANTHNGQAITPKRSRSGNRDATLPATHVLDNADGHSPASIHEVDRRRKPDSARWHHQRAKSGQYLQDHAQRNVSSQSYRGNLSGFQRGGQHSFARDHHQHGMYSTYHGRSAVGMPPASWGTPMPPWHEHAAFGDMSRGAISQDPNLHGRITGQRYHDQIMPAPMMDPASFRRGETRPPHLTTLFVPNDGSIHNGHPHYASYPPYPSGVENARPRQIGQGLRGRGGYGTVRGKSSRYHSQSSDHQRIGPDRDQFYTPPSWDHARGMAQHDVAAGPSDLGNYSIAPPPAEPHRLMRLHSHAPESAATDTNAFRGQLFPVYEQSFQHEHARPHFSDHGLSNVVGTSGRAGTIKDHSMVCNEGCGRTEIAPRCQKATHVVVHNVGSEITPEQLQQAFSVYGQVIQARPPLTSNKPAFIDFESVDGARECLRHRGQPWMLGDQLQVELSRSHWYKDWLPHRRFPPGATSHGMPRVNPWVNPSQHFRPAHIADGFPPGGQPNMMPTTALAASVLSPSPASGPSPSKKRNNNKKSNRRSKKETEPDGNTSQATKCHKASRQDDNASLQPIETAKPTVSTPAPGTQAKKEHESVIESIDDFVSAQGTTTKFNNESPTEHPKIMERDVDHIAPPSDPANDTRSSLPDRGEPAGEVAPAAENAGTALKLGVPASLPNATPDRHGPAPNEHEGHTFEESNSAVPTPHAPVELERSASIEPRASSDAEVIDDSISNKQGAALIASHDLVASQESPIDRSRQATGNPCSTQLEATEPLSSDSRLDTLVAIPRQVPLSTTSTSAEQDAEVRQASSALQSLPSSALTVKPSDTESARPTVSGVVQIKTKTKEKGPSTTESFSMYGRKNKDKPKQAKAKGSVKSKPKAATVSIDPGPTSKPIADDEPVSVKLVDHSAPAGGFALSISTTVINDPKQECQAPHTDVGRWNEPDDGESCVSKRADTPVSSLTWMPSFSNLLTKQKSANRGPDDDNLKPAPAHESCAGQSHPLSGSGSPTVEVDRVGTAGASSSELPEHEKESPEEGCAQAWEDSTAQDPDSVGNDDTTINKKKKRKSKSKKKKGTDEMDTKAGAQARATSNFSADAGPLFASGTHDAMTDCETAVTQSSDAVFKLDNLKRSPAAKKVESEVSRQKHLVEARPLRRKQKRTASIKCLEDLEGAQPTIELERVSQAERGVKVNVGGTNIVHLGTIDFEELITQAMEHQANKIQPPGRQVTVLDYDAYDTPESQNTERGRGHIAHDPCIERPFSGATTPSLKQEVSSEV